MSIIPYAHLKLYLLLKNELDECMRKHPFPLMVESCFLIAGKYWSQLRAISANYRFLSPQEEIIFFKMIKPLFTYELEFYCLLYHTVLFCPAEAHQERKFWEREAQRLYDFKKKNREFVDYYCSGRTEMDARYFMRMGATEAPQPEPELLDADPGSRSSHDHLVSRLWALERYNQYVHGKLMEASRK